MTATEADTVAELQRTNIALQERLDAALAQRASEFSERIDHQAATIDVLKAMSSTPDDIQPVFDLIVRRATELCNGVAAALYQFDGSLVHFRAVYHGVPDPGRFTAVAAMFPMAPTREVIACRAILDRQIVHIRDTQAEPGLSEAVRQRLRDSHRSQVSIPLMRDSQAIGAISLGGEEPGGFTDSQIALLETFAEQAVIAITSAETYRGLHESLEQQTATAEVLKVINTSPGNLMPVFNAMLEKAMRLCGAAFGMLRSFDGEQMRTVATRGVPPAFAEYSARTALTPMLASGPARALETGRPAQMMDITEGVAYQSGEPGARALADLGGARTVLHIPLFRDQASVGLFSFYRQEVRAFTGEQIALLENFAAQAVIAIENTRLLTEQREALEQQTATAELLQVINASPGNLVPVFDAILQKAHDLCDIAYGDLQLYDGEHLHSVAQRGLSAEFADRLRQGYRASDSPATRPLLAGDRFTHIIDAAAVDSMVFRSTVRLDGIRTVLFVPLRKDGSLLGMITSARRELRPFTEKEIALLENFAAQAVIAMENARLLTEQQEALERQTATAEVLEVINASPGNLTPVFDAMLEKAMRLCGAAFGSLYTYDGEHFHSAAQRGVPPAYAAFRAENPPLLTPGGGPATLLETRRPVHVLDLMKEESYRTGNLGIRAMVELGGIRTILSVPLLREDVFLGMIAIFRQEVRAYSEKEIALLQNFAAQAVIAMENARLIAEQREALERQTATAEVLEVINASPGNLAPVFEALLEKAMRLCGAAFGSLYTYDGERFDSAAQRGVPPAYAAYRARNPPPASGGGPAAIFETRRPLHVLDLMEEEPYRARNPGVRAMVELGGIRTILTVPLIKDDAFLGVITIYRQEVRAFTDKQISLLENFAAQAVIAMENARLLTEQREALEQQTATAEVLQVINASPADLTPVFATMLERAMRLCDAAFGSLLIYDGEHLRAAALRSVPEEFASFLRKPIVPEPGTAMAQVIDERRIVHWNDARAQEAYLNGAPLAMAGVEGGGVRTLIGVPLVKDGNLLGIVHLYRQEVRPFSDKHIALLQNFAAQAVIAMENARLITEQREALEQQTATNEVLRVINSSPGNLAPVFDTILERARVLCGFAHGTLNLFDGTHFYTVATYDIPEAFAEVLRRPRISGPQAPLLRGDRIIHIPDFQTVEATSDDPVSRAAIEAGIRTVLFVALRNERGLLGYLTADRMEVRPFSEKEIGVMESFAAQAVIAMENARLLNEVRQRQEELRITFENMGDGVAMFDETQHLVAWNSKFQQIYDLPDVLLEQQRTYEEHLHYLAARGDFGAGVDTVEQIHELVASTGQPYGYERTRPDGRVIEIRRNPVPDGGFVLIFSDITERKRSEAEIRSARDAAEEAYRNLKAAQANLIQAEKMASLGQLTAGIAHEIKNPLNFVNNFAALSVDLLSELKETAAPGFAALTEKQRAEIDEVSAMLTGNLEKIIEHGKRADGIVKAMLEHSRGSSGERRVVDLNVVIDEALNLAYHGARAQDQSFNIALERDFSEGIAPIEVNPQDMTRVFLNIFSNGFYAANKRAQNGAASGFVPTLKVSTRGSGDAVEIRVRDNGTGIPADIRDKLFQPFFTTKPTGEGTGLGLSITYDIVTQQHGGSIAVDSKVGEYSEFTIRLPRKP